VRYGCAGHLPPLLVAPDGVAEYLWDGRGAPLGVSSGEPYEEGEAKLEKGSSLALYTDGLVEVRGEVLDVGLERLCAAAEGGPPSAEALCAHLIETMVAEGARDDVALLTLHTARLGEGQTKLELTTDPATLVNVRLMLARWLREAGATEQEVYDVQLACHEACANAIEHAYGFREASFDLELSREGREVELAITDTGGWREPSGGDRGRGIDLMRATMEDVDVAGGPDGTSVRLRRRLGAPVPEAGPTPVQAAAD
jgi:anti-sigma regulatory factor (Ser/Thr protein kinase)